MAALKFWKMPWPRSGSTDGMRELVRISLDHISEVPMSRRAIILYACLMAASFVLLVADNLDALMV